MSTKMLQEIMEQPTALANIEEYNKETLTKLAQELNDKKVDRVAFSCRGTSMHASIYGEYLLAIKAGIVSTIIMPSSVTLYGASYNFGNSLVVGVSQSGAAADVMAVIEQANACGSVTVAITNEPDSPLAKLAKYHLYCNAGPEISVAATKTFTTQMAAIAYMIAYWKNDQKLLGCLRDLPKYAAETLAYCDSVLPELAKDYKDMTEGFILSRGLNYAISLEATLKLQETCYIKIKGFAASDFWHGPLAQVQPGMPVIVYAPKGVALKNCQEIADKIREIGVTPLMITNDKDTAAQGVSALVPDTGCEFTQPFVFAIFAQRFAEKVCELKGLNPDAPRNLKKVTITK